MKPTFTIHIVANNASLWNWPEKIAAIKAFWASVFNLEITLENTNFVIPFVEESSLAPLRVVETGWYDEHIAKRTDIADIVMLVVPPGDREGFVTPFGIMTGYSTGTWETTLFSDERSTASVLDRELGNTFVLFANHELSHVFHQMRGIEDTTHTHFYAGYPERVLPVLAFPTDRLPYLLTLLLIKLKMLAAAMLARRRSVTSMIMDIHQQDLAPRVVLYQAALSALGTDVSPKDGAPDELACADSMNELHRNAFGVPITNDNQFSTIGLDRAFSGKPFYELIPKPEPGDIAIAVTGTGNGSIKHGHTGVVMDNGRIWSNDSDTGLFIDNFSVDKFVDYFGRRGGMKVKFYRVIKKPE